VPASKTPDASAKRFLRKLPAADAGKSPAELIDQRIADLQDWRGELLAELRALIMGAHPRITEEWKWNTPVWSCKGILCTGESYKKVVKLSFAKGARLPDPSRLFNSSLEGNLRRAIDFPEGTAVNATALLDLVRAAVSVNQGSAGAKSRNAA